MLAVCLLALLFPALALADLKISSVLDDSTLIPEVDLSQPLGQIVESIRRAAESGGPGFFYLINHGIPETVLDDAIREAHKFHSMPTREKLNISSIGYGGGTVSTKGYVPPKGEGSYDKDESDVRPEAEKESGQRNLREALVFRYPEESVVKDEKYYSDYVEFLNHFDTLISPGASPRPSHDGPEFKFSHPGNRRANVSVIEAATRRFYQANQWPRASDVPEFRTVVQRYFDHMRKLAEKMYSLFGAAMDRTQMSDPDKYIPSDLLPHDKGMMTFNLVHYPPLKDDDNKQMGIVDHTDWEAFTLLYPAYLQGKHLDSCLTADNNVRDSEDCTSMIKANPYLDQQSGVSFTGLEVWFQDRWVAVPHIPGAIIVNQGEMLSRLSGGRFKAPVHRVMAKNDFERYSLVSFWAPNFDLILPDTEAPFGKVLSGEHYLKRNGLLEV